MSYFITGTDTGVGKTHVACLLLRALNAAGRPALGFKPIACGDRFDAEALRAAGADPALPLDLINPVWFRAPAAPLAASMIENRPVDRDGIRKAYAELASRAGTVLIEGAGGWEVPVRVQGDDGRSGRRVRPAGDRGGRQQTRCAQSHHPHRESHCRAAD